MAPAPDLAPRQEIRRTFIGDVGGSGGQADPLDLDAEVPVGPLT
ncbi:hypothetical protein [Streptomyces sp. NBC_00063]